MFWATDWSTIADPVDRNASSTRTLELVCCTGHICAEFRSFVWSHSICWLVFSMARQDLPEPSEQSLSESHFHDSGMQRWLAHWNFFAEHWGFWPGLQYFGSSSSYWPQSLSPENAVCIRHLEYDWNTVASVSWRNASLRARAPDSVLWTGLLVVASFTLLVQFIRVIQTVVFT